MAEQILFLAGIAGAVAAVSVLRLSWARPGRSKPLNAAGWCLIAASLAAGWIFAGAWGVTVISLWAMGTAFVALAIAAWRSPATIRKASRRRARMLPESGEPLRVGRRSVTFLLVVLAGMVAAIALAIATRWVALLAGASEANANVLALFVAPLGWTIMTFMILMTERRKRQLAIILVTVATAIPAFAAGNLP
jgi:hypothetical protein